MQHLSFRRVGTRWQLVDSYHMMKSSAKSWSKNFAKVGGVYATVDCVVEKTRGRHDLKNPLMSGCVSGAVFANKTGPIVRFFLGCVASFSVCSRLCHQMVV